MPDNNNWWCLFNTQYHIHANNVCCLRVICADGSNVSRGFVQTLVVQKCLCMMMYQSTSPTTTTMCVCVCLQNHHHNPPTTTIPPPPRTCML